MNSVIWREVSLWINYVKVQGECSEEYKRRFHSVFSDMAKVPSLGVYRTDILLADRDMQSKGINFDINKISKLFFCAHLTSILHEKFTHDEIAEVSEYFNALVQGSWVNPHKQKVLDIIIDVPREQRGEFVAIVKPLLDTVTLDHLKCDFLRRILPFPSNERIQICKLSSELIDKTSPEYLHYALVDALCRIEFPRRNSVSQCAMILMDGITQSHDKHTILFTVSNLSDEEMDDVCQAAKELFTSDSSAECRKQILLGLKSIKIEKRLCIQNICKLMRHSLDIEQDMPVAIKILRRFSISFLKLMEDKISSFQTTTSKNWVKRLKILSFFPEDIKNQFLNQIDLFYDCLNVESEYDAIFFIISNDKELKMEMWKYLFQKINHSSFLELSIELIEKRHYFLIEENSLLFEEASRIVLQYPQSSRCKKNLDSFASLLKSSMQSVDHVNLVVYSKDEEDFVLHPKIVYDSFPQKITVPIVKSLFGGQMPTFVELQEIVDVFESKVNSSREDQKALLEQEVFQSVGQKIEDVLNNLRSVFFKYHITVNDEYDVSLHHAMMCSVFASLKEKSTALNEGFSFTPQERMLILISSVIKGSYASQLNGLYKMYAMLDRQYQYINREVFLYAPQRRRVYSWIQHHVFKMVCSMFEQDSPFIKELLKGKLLYSASLTLYLRNRIGAHIGIGNTVCFDDESSINYDQALRIQTIDLLNMFYRSFSPKYVVNTLRSLIKNDFEEQPLVDDITSLLNEKLEPSAIWEGDCLSEDAMVHLLRELALFEVVR